jgi:hypothetical protein
MAIFIGESVFCVCGFGGIERRIISMSDVFPGAAPLRGLPVLRPFKRRRESSWDRTGGNRDRLTIPPGDTAVLAHIEGAGIITHIWFTLRSDEDHFLRKILLRMFWDGEESPSVIVPVGDFFGIGHGLTANYASLPLQMSPQNGRGFNCFFPMPFCEGARIEVANEGTMEVPAFYFYIDYEEHERIGNDLGRFHAQWRRENPCQGWGDFDSFKRRWFVEVDTWYLWRERARERPHSRKRWARLCAVYARRFIRG